MIFNLRHANRKVSKYVVYSFYKLINVCDVTTIHTAESRINMAKKNSKNYKVFLGNPEHVVTPDRARDLLKNKLLFKPNTNNNEIDQGMLFMGDGEKPTFDAKAFEGRYGLEASNANEGAIILADEAISRLEGNTLQFDKFTVESIGILNQDMMETLIASGSNDRLADDIDTAINMLPSSNGKTFTTVQTLRTAEYMLDDDKFATTCKYANNEARIPKSWYDYEKSGLPPVERETTIGVDANGEPEKVTTSEMRTIAPRGLSDLDRYVEIADTPFTQLSESQQTAIVNLYADSPEALDAIVEEHASAADAEVNVDLDSALAELNEEAANNDIIM